MTPVNESLGSGDSARTLRLALGDALYSEGDRLAESGGVLEVRVLQGGQIVTGIVGDDSASIGADRAAARVGAESTTDSARAAGAMVGPKGGADGGMQVGSKPAADGGTQAGSELAPNGGSQVGSELAPNGGGQVGSNAAATGGGKGAAKYRVYIRGTQRECSCGARGVCVHVAAVSIVAARTGGGAPARGAGARVAPAAAGVASDRKSVV